MSWTIARRLAVGFAVPMVALAATLVVAAWLAVGLDGAFQSLLRRGRIQVETERLYRLVMDAESGQRGYLLTAEVRYLTPYEEAIKHFDSSLDRLRKLCAEESTQVQRLDALQPSLRRKLAHMEQTIAAQRSEGRERAMELVRAGEGNRLGLEIRDALQLISRDEEAQLVRENAAVENANWTLMGGLAILGGGALAATMVGGGWVGRGLGRPVEQLRHGFNEVGKGNLDFRMQIRGVHEFEHLAESFNRMVAELAEARRTTGRQEWLSHNQAQVGELLQGVRDPVEMGEKLLSFLAPLLEARSAGFFVADDELRALPGDVEGNGGHLGSRPAPRVWGAPASSGALPLASSSAGWDSESYAIGGGDGNSSSGSPAVGTPKGGLPPVRGGGSSEPPRSASLSIPLGREAGPKTMRLLASYAFTGRKRLANSFVEGEGLVGQSALERKAILLTNAPADYLEIESGLGKAAPSQILVQPAVDSGRTIAVLEFATFGAFTVTHLELLERLSSSLAVGLKSLAAQRRTERLLARSQEQAEELQSQQEELKEANQRLEEQAEELHASQESMRRQQEDLKRSNQELEESAEELAAQKRMLTEKNHQVELASRALREKADQLAQASKYKSEFLANMSHELRTPLNSLLILSQLLSANKDGNLTPKQVEYLQTIHAAGADLLQLINDVLDMAKVESGTMQLAVEEVSLAELTATLDRGFQQVAKQKGIGFEIETAASAPASIPTDQRRLVQILRNLIGNALKFTDKGRVRVRTAVLASNVPSRVHQASRGALAFAVEDSGIGIPADMQEQVFEPFRQAAGGADRKYGGTGLGLSISRELAQRLGGTITLQSEMGRGSVFTLWLPLGGPPAADEDGGAPSFIRREGEGEGRSSASAGASSASRSAARRAREEAVPAATFEPWDSGRPLLLVIEDDPRFGQLLVDTAQSHGFEVLWAKSAAEAVALAERRTPAAITLDLGLPDRTGAELLAELRRDVRLRHTPIHVISAADPLHAPHGADFLQKPVSEGDLSGALERLVSAAKRPLRRVLVVEDHDLERESIRSLLETLQVEAVGAATVAQALSALEKEPFDALVVDLRLGDASGLDFLRQVRARWSLDELPAIVYTGASLDESQELEIERLAGAVILKEGRSPDRLLAETTRFLRRVRPEPAQVHASPAAAPPSPPQPAPPQAKPAAAAPGVSAAPSPASAAPPPTPVPPPAPVGGGADLTDRKILVVDDDVRNVFALTAALEEQGLQVTAAMNGREALEALEAGPDFDIVLMDVMMPEMDGHETIRRIRAQPKFQKLPILAVTAKAMKGDREQSLAAGASDHVAKPVDMPQLLSLMKIWIAHQ